MDKEIIADALKALGWTEKNGRLHISDKTGTHISVSFRKNKVLAELDGPDVPRIESEIEGPAPDVFLELAEMWRLFGSPSRRRGIVVYLIGQGWNLSYHPEHGFLVSNDTGKLHTMIAFDADEHIVSAAFLGRKRVRAYHEDIFGQGNDEPSRLDAMHAAAAARLA